MGNEWKDEYNNNKSALKKLYKLKPEKFEILSKSYDISSTNKKDVMIYLLENKSAKEILKIIAHLNLIVEHNGVYSDIIGEIYNLTSKKGEDVAIFVLKNFKIREQTTLLSAIMADDDYKQYGFDIDMINLHKKPRKDLYWIDLCDCSRRLIPSSFADEILERENYSCSICGKEINKSTGVLKLIKTIAPKSSMYFDPENHVEKDNITAVCAPCNKLIKEGCNNGSIINLTDRFVLHNYKTETNEMIM